LNFASQELSSAISNIFKGLNVEASIQFLAISAQSLSLNSEKATVFGNSISELSKTFVANATQQQNALFLEKLEAFKSAYKAAINSQQGFENFFNDSTVLNDPLNQELLQLIAKFEETHRTLTASTALAFFTSTETSVDMARTIVLFKQAYDRFMASGEFFMMQKNFIEF
jgi:hypothetical protein